MFDLKCLECQIAIDTLGVAAVNKDENLLQKIVIEICEKFRIEDNQVCPGIIEGFGKELFNVIDMGFKLDSQAICFYFFSACTDPPAKKNWNPTFPKPKPPVVDPQSQLGNSSYVTLHITDLHYDQLYKVGSSVECGEPDCCREKSPFLKADGPKAREWGEYKCDLAPKMLQTVLETIESQNKADIMLWTGDTPSHFLWWQNLTIVMKDTADVTSEIKRIYTSKNPNLKVIPSIGNHESYPVNNFGPPPLNHILYENLSQDWISWIGKEAAYSLAEKGYFSLRFPSKVSDGNTLKVISLQTNYCNNLAFFLYLNDTDPGKQLEWLISELQDSEDRKNESVWISGHIPPSNSDCRNPYSENLVKIINRYENIVTGQFYGHTHKDHFSIDFVGNRPSTVQYIAPSVTTYQNINPSWRYYYVDSKSHRIIDTETWHYDLNDIYSLNQTSPKPVLEYRAKSAYNMTDLFAPSWFKLVERFETDDNLFQVFYKRKHTNYYKEGKCEGNCKETEICALLAGYNGRNCSYVPKEKNNLC